MLHSAQKPHSLRRNDAAFGPIWGLKASVSQCGVTGVSNRVEDSHRWPRLTVVDEWYGRICVCGNLKTDQAVSCKDCARIRHTPGYWERRTCPDCGGPMSRQARRCRPCAKAAMVGVSVDSGRPQPQTHRWRKAA